MFRENYKHTVGAAQYMEMTHNNCTEQLKNNQVCRE